MKRALKNSAKALFRNIDIQYCNLVLSGVIARHAGFEKLMRNIMSFSGIELLLSLPREHSSRLSLLLRKSRSQLGQDLFVLSESDFKNNGYFVEFGATNGVDLSNTYLLEKEFGWSGILAEAARCWHLYLRANRNCHIETDCVWSDSHSVLTFNETVAAEFSTIDTFSSGDMYRNSRQTGKNYDVRTISLYDLLDRYNAPREIDYLSIDTEGSEFEILNSFDFGKYKFGVITCEHNFTSARDKIHSLLAGEGYIRKYEALSDVDDWYVRKN